jgi:tryptophanase
MHAEKDPETDEEITSAMELVRLAIPHRVYTQSHIDYVVEAILQVYERRASITGYRIVSQPKFLRHFTARFEPINVLTNLETLRAYHGEQLLGQTTGSSRPLV